MALGAAVSVAVGVKVGVSVAVTLLMSACEVGVSEARRDEAATSRIAAKITSASTTIPPMTKIGRSDDPGRGGGVGAGG